MRPLLTKTDYRRFLACPSSLWFSAHEPVRLLGPNVSDLWRFEQGNDFETLVRQRFLDGRMITGSGDEAVRETRQAIDSGVRTLFQATVISPDGCLAKADMLERDRDSDGWSLYEVKSSTEVKDEHLDDVAFQWHAFERSGYPLSRAFVVHVDNSLVRNGELAPEAISVFADVTSQVQERLQDIRDGISRARRILENPSPPSPDVIPCNSKPADCPCADHCYPGLPAFSVFNLPRIRFADAQRLYRSGIVSVTDIADISSLSDHQQLHVIAAQNGTATIDRPAIRDFLNQLEWPLSFFDYETVNPVLPMFDGYRPFENIVFQYSLHTLQAADAEPQHAAFLGDGSSDPAPLLASQLADDLPASGSVLVWNKSFEMARNREMAARCPEFSAFFEQLNNRIVDLMDIVRKGHYIAPGFRGSASIKKVLPVLAPSLDYTTLDISDGSTASAMWHRMATGISSEPAETIRSQLLDYCHLDTLALVKLHRFFCHL